MIFESWFHLRIRKWSIIFGTRWKIGRKWKGNFPWIFWHRKSIFGLIGFFYSESEISNSTTPNGLIRRQLWHWNPWYVFLSLFKSGLGRGSGIVVVKKTESVILQYRCVEMFMIFEPLFSYVNTPTPPPFKLWYKHRFYPKKAEMFRQRNNNI